jgi:hypothetical protein
MYAIHTSYFNTYNYFKPTRNTDYKAFPLTTVCVKIIDISPQADNDHNENE